MKTISEIRADFPILNRTIHNRPLIYFDNGATSQTPTSVIEAIVHYYTYQNANIHRGVHTLSQEATDAYEQARQKLQRHFNLPKLFLQQAQLTASTWLPMAMLLL